MPPAPTTTKTLTASTNGTLIKSPEDFKLDDAMTNATPAPTVVSNGVSKRRVGADAKNGVKSTENVETQVDMHGTASRHIVWRNVILFLYLHSAALYGGYLWISGQVMWQTFLWGTVRTFVITMSYVIYNQCSYCLLMFIIVLQV